MTIYIPKFFPPVEYFCIWGGGFTPDECDTIIQQGELAEFSKGRIGEQSSDGINENVRDSDLTWLQPNDETDWIFQRMASIGSRINFDKFQLDLTRYDGFQYTKYKVDGHYDWHTDIMTQPPNPELHRKLSFITLLADPSEYEGGDLLMAPSGNNGNHNVLRPKKGDIVAFYSFIPHKVTPVTSGERVSLVTWAMGPKFK